MVSPEREIMLPGSPPVDKFNIVYCIMLLHGIGTLMPWNMFITIAPMYFVNYKLMENKNGTLVETDYSKQFFSYLGICSQLPNLLLNLANIFVDTKGGLNRRIGGSLIIVGIICIITTVFVKIDTTEMVTAFFFITMITVVILNAANGIYQNSIYGLVAAFPSQFTNAIVLGNNLCGTFVSVISILTITMFEGSVTNAALAYFVIAVLTIAACFISFFMLPQFEFYNYYIKKHEKDEEEAGTANKESKKELYISTFKQCWVQCLSIFLVFFVTLTIFPAIMADVKPVHRNTLNDTYNFFIPEKLFTPITTFLLFNSLAMIGSMTANFVQWPSSRYIIIPAILRIVLIPIMMLCNFRPERRTWPVLIYNEYIYIMLGIIMSFTSGYFSSLGMMYAPKAVEPSKAPVAGMMSAFFLICGMLLPL
ncbi:unnamed protein product [Enterobius vermicularis]|uniref:Equilibrative nucleoside transporter 1-like n=1 Tax=Enterobius vermicularis TaxID=51028 RepID=A0A0N4VA54_ENTVE|nr:unnamed protein product [Enterobius vermicularis]